MNFIYDLRAYVWFIQNQVDHDFNTPRLRYQFFGIVAHIWNSWCIKILRWLCNNIWKDSKCSKSWILDILYILKSSFKKFKILVISSFLLQHMKALVRKCWSETFSMIKFKAKFKNLSGMILKELNFEFWICYKLRSLISKKVETLMISIFVQFNMNL